MTKEELKGAIATLGDGGSAQVIADKVIEANDMELSLALYKKVMEKASEGHHQAKEFALAGLKVLNA